jgi:hypothetical protein
MTDQFTIEFDSIAAATRGFAGSISDLGGFPARLAKLEVAVAAAERTAVLLVAETWPTRGSAASVPTSCASESWTT